MLTWGPIRQMHFATREVAGSDLLLASSMEVVPNQHTVVYLCHAYGTGIRTVLQTDGKAWTFSMCCRPRPQMKPSTFQHTSCAKQCTSVLLELAFSYALCNDGYYRGLINYLYHFGGSLI